MHTSEGRAELLAEAISRITRMTDEQIIEALSVVFSAESVAGPSFGIAG